MTRYVIIGAGAIGATLAAQLHTAGRRVVLVARGRNLAALRADGLRYLRPDGERRIDLPVVGGPDEMALDGEDVLVLATKSQDTEAAMARWAWRPVRGGGTAAAGIPIIMLQNGLDNERAALRRFVTVFGAMVWLPASHLSPGEVLVPTAPAVGAFWLGTYPRGRHDRLAEIGADLTDAGFVSEVVDDVVRWKAGKLVGNVANALDALYQPSPLREEATAAVREEARSVLTEAGFAPADVAAGSLPQLADVAVRSVPGHDRGGSSTWQSLARHTAPETDFLNGEVVLQARLIGRPAPHNAALAERVQRAAAEAIPAGSLGDEDLAVTLPGLGSGRRTPT
jgi:2-dehydropantoate 2-reductase